jgi:cation diffusion facilitator CzcD-associated flavoprotein CzcO
MRSTTIPVVERTSVIIVGTGFAGLGMAIKLRDAGMTDFVVLEKDDGVGGTWRVNHYPGAQCDIPSHLYSFSFAPNPTWTRTFPMQPEILAYLERVTDDHGVRPHLRLGAEVIDARWDEATATWEVAARDGRRWRAPVVVSGTGGLSRPAWPRIPGMDTFLGPSWHSARWDHDVPLRGKRIAVIGTGASAIQVVPRLQPDVTALHVYQRTPPWIVPHTDRAISATERALFARAPITQRAMRAAIYWQHEARAYAFTVRPGLLKLAQKRVEKFIAASVRDPALRAKVTPSYTLGCKRILISSEWYPAIQRPNVEVITDGIAAIEPRGIRTTDGTLREVDAIVYCTGFAASEDLAPFPITGRDGRTLSAAWQDGAEAYLGTTITGFPNLFVLVGPNTGLGHSSMVFMIESQVAYVVDALAQMRARGWRSVDVMPRAQEAYNRDLHARLDRTVWNTGGCASWYRTPSGKNVTLWPGFTAEYRLRTRRFDASAYRIETRAIDREPASAPLHSDARAFSATS